MSARLLTSSILRAARPRASYHVRTPQRTLFGIGAKPEPPTAGASPMDGPRPEVTKMARMLADKPDVVNAIMKFSKVMEEAGVPMTGKLPGPIQLMKLAGNVKFKEAFLDLQTELERAGIDIRSKELQDQMMKVAKELPRSE
ncbi:hypothetical protein DFH07DRAFT_801102 [Mycena maculata]|uniref:Uncharacterized protein n=1 Tax=Mycena maculata TaxID=230809 RepID=A0AAD7K0K0_9AGAR|nr:hypothetical protein DFH07DRAFT_801102 [Mycena maculata]